jgi:hypothetical protein
LQLDTRALVIVLKIEAMFIEGHQMVFEGCFENTNEGQMMSCFSNKVGHHLWLHGPLNYLCRERRASYLSHLVVEVGVFIIVFSSHVCCYG